MASRDLRNPSSPPENSANSRNTINGESSLHSIFNALSLSEDSQINGRASSSRIANGADSAEAGPSWAVLHQQERDPITENRGFNSLVNGPYGAHVNPNALRFPIGMQESSPIDRVAQVSHRQGLDLFGGFSVNETSNNHGMLYNNLLHEGGQATNDHGPLGLGRFGGQRFDFYGRHCPLLHGSQVHQMNLKSFRGRIVALAQDRFYSVVLIRNILDLGLSVVEVEMILCEVLGCLNDLMNNQFGCRFVLKLFLACNEDQRAMVLQDIARYPSKLVQTCLSLNGFKSMQKILANLNSHGLIRLMTFALGRVAVPLSTYPNASRLIMYCVNNFGPEYNQDTFVNIAHYCYEVSTTKSGCVVIQDCVKRSNGHLRSLLLTSISARALDLAEDPYGNYVVQQLIELNIPHALDDLLVQFKGHFVSFSCNKYASHVVERLLSCSRGSNASEMIKELIMSPEFPALLLDQYANYVVQSALLVSHAKDLPEFTELLELVRANKSCMETNIYGQKILSRFKK